MSVVEPAATPILSDGRIPSKATTGPLPAPTLGAFLSDTAKRHGQLPALVTKPAFRTLVTTYRELEQTALRIARYLQEQGFEPGDRLVIWAPNSPQWVELFFGCHLAGVVVVPLDVRSSPEFVGTVLDRTEPRLVVTSRFTLRQGLVLDYPTLDLEQLISVLPAEATLLRPVTVDSDDLASIMFTSGTTGDPKGVMLTHRNILSNVIGAETLLSADPSFRLISLLPLSHMLEQTCGLLMPLHGGARIVYPVSRQPSAIFRTIREQQITMICLVPQALDLFFSAIEREARRAGRERQLAKGLRIAEHLPIEARRIVFRSIHARMGGQLRHVICGGAYLDPDLAHHWELMGVNVLQGYGATEASPIITGDSPTARKVGAVGRAIPGDLIRIAADGELLARGDNIFVGYWQNPQATAAALVDGWYHTGDLGEIDEDGFLFLRGRKKDLIVLSDGQNVYPEDVESQLIHETSVSEAVVLGVPGERGVEVHAVLLMRDPEQAASAVHSANERLSDHQRIQHFTVWPHEDLPRTHTLKVKKAEVLKYLEGQASDTADSAPPPPPAVAANPVWSLLHEIGGIALAEISPSATLGGDLNLDSLGRVELLSAIEDELGVHVDETAISPDTTVAELETAVATAVPRLEGGGLVSWPLSRPAGVLRELLVQAVVFPAYHLVWQVRVVGRERIAGVRSPVMVAVNHNFGAGELGFDPAAAWMALPRDIRLRICTAGEEHAVFDRRIRGFLARLCNAFPLSQEGNVRGSLEYMGALLDRGWSVLIFPEGKLTVGGPIQPFMGGTGLLAVEAVTPVIPMRIDVTRKSRLEGGKGRGAFTVTVGKPLEFPPGTSYAAATELIEAAVRGL